MDNKTESVDKLERFLIEKKSIKTEVFKEIYPFLYDIKQQLSLGIVGISLPNKEELLSVYEQTIAEKHKCLHYLEKEWIKLGFMYYHRYLSDKNNK